jgi:hypothetical protein
MTEADNEQAGPKRRMNYLLRAVVMHGEECAFGSFLRF